MKNPVAGDSVEVALGPHPARAGWEVARITYNTRNVKHLAQIDAAIAGLLAARGECSPTASQDAGAALRR